MLDPRMTNPMIVIEWVGNPRIKRENGNKLGFWDKSFSRLMELVSRGDRIVLFLLLHDSTSKEVHWWWEMNERSRGAFTRWAMIRAGMIVECIWLWLCAYRIHLGDDSRIGKSQNCFRIVLSPDITPNVHLRRLFESVHFHSNHLFSRRRKLPRVKLMWPLMTVTFEQ